MKFIQLLVIAGLISIWGCSSISYKTDFDTEIDFSKSLRERVSLLEGLSVDSLTDVYNNIPLTQGAESLIKVLKRLGYKTAVISGGFNYFTHKL